MSVSTSDLSSCSLSPSVAPNQVPKAGTVIPNRIFVGGIATQTTDLQLKEFFSAFGAVKDTKIICDRGGISKGYGFVTFETQDDADKIINKDSENLIFKDRKLNIGPAVRKQQAFPRIDGLSVVPNGATAMLLAQSYGYNAHNGIAVLPPDAYQHAIQQQVQPQLAAANYSNMILPAQLPIYMQQATYPPYTATAMQNQIAAQTLPYANTGTQWVPAGCYQPAVTAVNTGNIYPDSMLYAAAPTANQGLAAQFLEVPEGTMHENNNNDVESRCASVPTSVDGLHSQLANCPSITSLMSVPTARSIHQPHSFHGNTSPQPPPVKKMATMQPHHYSAGDGALRCFSAPLVGGGGSMKPMLSANGCSGQRMSGLTFLTPSHHDVRVKFEHDSRLANIAPPTPPPTPAGGTGGVGNQ